jgi:hypothetical protein
LPYQQEGNMIPTTDANTEPGTRAPERRMDDDAIRALVSRLARPHSSGGKVVERAALLAEGADFRAVMAWITAHGGIPETMNPVVAGAGLHSARLSAGNQTASETPRRFVLPPGALT